MEIKDVINNLKRQTNIVIIAKETTGDSLTVYKGNIQKYKRYFSNSSINSMCVYSALFVNKNGVEITFYINLRVLKEALKREDK